MALGKIFLSGFGGLTAAFASMLCCTGPLVMASVGLSGAGLAAMRPYRPIFLVITGVFLWLAYRQMEREDSCDSDKPCADPRNRRRMKWALWTMTGIAVVFATSPRWAGWVF
jgi:mercuric ion transport protein